jgi:hypothetical protein
MLQRDMTAILSQLQECIDDMVIIYKVSFSNNND